MNKVRKNIVLVILSVLTLVSFAGGAYADAVPWQLGFQEAASPVMERLTDFHNMLLVIITAISLFVLFLLMYVCFRFSEKRNPKPSKTSHNTLIEIIWTTVPIIILVAIAIPSFRHLYFMDRTETPDMTLKVIGYQWYWGYEYPDHGNIAFDSYIVKDEDLKEGQVRLLEVDNRIVLPVETNVRILTTAADVIHAWAVPALGVKMDAVPGRLNETWVRINKPGVYRGQCSELCGAYHGYMPVVIEAVSKEKFEQWVKKAKKQFTALPEQMQQVALLNH